MRNNAVRVLRVSSALTLAGWGMIHLFWDPPYRSILWSEQWFGWFASGILRMNWTDYATSSHVEFATQTGIRMIGASLIIAGVFALVKARPSKLLFAGSAFITIVALCLFKTSGLQVGEFIEQAGQISAPALLFLALSKSTCPERFSLLIKSAIALTFFGHGLYAVGYYPQPGHFIDMTINILGVTEPQARVFLKIAGIMDFLVALSVFVPRLARPALAYAFAWGALTSLARPISHLASGNETTELLFWFVEGFRRAPHAGLALAALMLPVRDQDFSWGFKLLRSSFSTSTVAGVPTPFQREV